jgi:hypothetical protein
MISRTAREVFEELAGEHLSRPEAGRRWVPAQPHRFTSAITAIWSQTKID